MDPVKIEVAKVVVQSGVQQLVTHPVAGPRLQALSFAFVFNHITVDELGEEVDALILLYLD